MYQQDWIMRQIEMIGKMLAYLLFRKRTTEYEAYQEEKDSEDMLHKLLVEMIDAGKVNEAENLLFQRMAKENLYYLKLAIDFYGRLNRLSDQRLEECCFSRTEIAEGLKDAAAFYGVDIPWE